VATYVYGERYQKPDRSWALYKQVFEQLRATPGIESVGMTSTIPLGGNFDRVSCTLRTGDCRTRPAPSPDRYGRFPGLFPRDAYSTARRPRVHGPGSAGWAQAIIVSESCARLAIRRAKIPVRERAAAEQWNTHHVEIIGETA